MNAIETTTTGATAVLVPVDRARRPDRTPRCCAARRTGGFVRAPSGSRRDDIVLAGFAALLHRYTGRARIALDRHGADGTEALELEVRPDESLSGLAARGPARATGTGATVGIRFAPSGTTDTPGVREEPHELLLVCEDGHGGSIELELRYDATLFDDATAARMLDHLTVLLADDAEHPDRPVSRLRLLTREEQQRMLVEWNRTDADLPHGVCLHEAFEQCVDRDPDAVAVRHEGRSWTYGRVDVEANRLAHHLRSFGVGPDVRVGLCLDRSPELLIAIMGILKAGGAYVPLDPSYPAQRIATMVDGTSCAALISRSDLTDSLSEDAVASRPLVLVDRDAARLAEWPDEPPVRPAEPDDLCYVFHTSGSTGAPKPIALRHRGVMNNLADINRRFDVGPGDAVLAVSSPSFDLSVNEFLGMSTAGGTIVVSERARASDPAHWADLVTDERVTVWNSAPALFGLLLDAREQTGGAPFDRLRLALLGGDWAPVTLPERARAIAPGLQVIVMGGATEASIYSTVHDATEADVRRPSIPYGRPMANQRTYILDEAGEPVPPGVAGELYLAGIGLARGYLDQPERTAERFREWSYGDVVRDRVYRTGDLARYDATGLIELLGRIDFQTKINSHRVEPGEIEAVLRTHPDVGQAVVVVRDGRLAAHLTPSADGVVLDDDRIAEVRELAAGHLPSYMVPTAIAALDVLPLTPNGKVDRLGLPEIDVPDSEYRAPATPAEQVVTDVFADVLGADRVGADDDFVALGGDSIRSIQVVTRLRARGWATTTQDVLRRRTVAAVAAQLAPLGAAAEDQLPTGPLVETGEEQMAEWRDRYPGLREVWPLTPMQAGMVFESTMDDTGRDVYQVQTVYRLAGPVEPDRLRRACAGLVAQHSALRVAFTPSESDELVQVVVDGVEARWTETDLTHLDGAAQDDAFARFLDADADERFDLETPPLLRFALVHRGPDRSDLVCTAHHALVDGWSERAIGRELHRLYADGPGAPAAPAPDFRDFLAWLSARDTGRSRTAWAGELAGLDEPTLIAPAADARGGGADVAEIVLHDPVPRSREVTRTCGELGVTVNTLVQAAWGVVLGGLTGRDDVVFGATVSGRPATLAGVESMVGLFINTIPVRVTTAATSSVAGLLGDLQDRQSAMADHHHHGLTDIHRTLGVDALFDSLVVFQSAPAGAEPGGGLSITGTESIGRVSYPLALLVEPDRMVLQYHRDRIGPAAAEAIAQRFARVLGQMVDDPDRSLGSVDLLLPDERTRYTATRQCVRPTAPETLLPLVERYAAATPDVPAIVFGGTSLTYAVLNARANQLAHDLIAQGVGADSVVGVTLPPSTQLAIALLGTLKSGAAHVVVDPAHPRRDALLAEAGTARTLGWLDVETSSSAVPLDPTDQDRTSGLHPLAVACVRFPDRDADRPRGVAVGHQVLAEELLRYTATAGISPGTRLLCGVSGDDRIAFEILAGLCRGAVVELVRDADALGGPDTTADVLSTTAPRIARGLSRDTGAGAATVVLAGDVPGGGVPRSLIRRIRTAMPDTDVITISGTPAVPRSFADRADPVDDDGGRRTCPVGVPVGNQRAYVLDRTMRPLPDGTVGELYVAGAVAQGFHRRPGATAEHFVADPWGSPGTRMHRTGVLARRDDTGRLEILGPPERRITVDGHRFWPQEVEAVLAGHPGVATATVSVRDGDVLARVAPRSGGSEPVGSDVRAFTAQHLPPHMVPDVVEIDRAEPPAGGDATGAGEPPSTVPGDRTAALCELFADVLGIDRVGVDDNVFDLGVDSLLAGRLVSRIRRTLGVKVPIRTLFQKPTLAELGAELSTARTAPARPTLRRRA